MNLQCPNCQTNVASAWTVCGVCGARNPETETNKEPCILSHILAAEIQKYQPFTPCIRAIKSVIDAADKAGLIGEMDAISRVAPKHIHKKKP